MELQYNKLLTKSNLLSLSMAMTLVMLSCKCAEVVGLFLKGSHSINTIRLCDANSKGAEWKCLWEQAGDYNLSTKGKKPKLILD